MAFLEYDFNDFFVLYDILHYCNVVMEKNVMEKKNSVEMPGIEPGAFHMQSERYTTELHRHPGR